MIMAVDGLRIKEGCQPKGVMVIHPSLPPDGVWEWVPPSVRYPQGPACGGCGWPIEGVGSLVAPATRGVPGWARGGGAPQWSRGGGFQDCAWAPPMAGYTPFPTFGGGGQGRRVEGGVEGHPTDRGVKIRVKCLGGLQAPA